MNTGGNNASQSYKNAVHALKELNNELFYDDLKDDLRSHIERFEIVFNDVIDQIEGMKIPVEQLPNQLEDSMKEIKKDISGSSLDMVEQTNREILQAFKQPEQNLIAIIKNFSTLQSNFVKLQANFSSLYEEQKKRHHEFIEEQRQMRQKEIEQIEGWFQEHKNSIETLWDVFLQKVDEHHEQLRTTQAELEKKQEDRLLVIEGNLKETLKEQQEGIQELRKLMDTQFTSRLARMEEQNENLQAKLEVSTKNNRILFWVVLALAVGEAILLNL